MALNLLQALLLTCVACYGSKAQEVKVICPAGRFLGKILTSLSGQQYAAFRGIPYAIPPVGQRRFAKPEPHPKIQGLHNATEFGPICLQLSSVAGQEDCLYLNVFIPVSPEKRVETSELRKVLVFIHGGGFVFGSSNTYLPGDLVCRANLVVVTFNYRLGLLGFLRGNSDSLPGNQAFLDQIVALQWVTNNIQAFGGDATDVTVSGESAGSLSISILSLSPLTKGLFTKAILMSGSGLWYPCPHKSSNDLLYLIAAKLGCSNDSQTEDIGQMVACLKDKSAADLEPEFHVSLISSLVSSGDSLLPRPLPELVKDVHYLTDIGFNTRDYIVSFTKHDGSIVVDSSIAKVDTSSVDASVPEIAKILVLPQKATKRLVTEYNKIFHNLKEAVIAIFTDGRYILKGLQFVDTYLSTNPSPTNKAFLLQFDHSPTYIENSYMLHLADLLYLFDLDPQTFLTGVYHLKVQGAFTDSDLRLKALTIDIISDFIHTGYPKTSLEKHFNLSWPEVTSSEQPYLSWSLQPYVGTTILGARERIWREELPHWIQEQEDQVPKEEL